MEILNETIHYGEFWSSIVFFGGLGILLLLMGIAFWWSNIKERNFTLDSVTGASGFTFIGIILAIFTIQTINHGANITYEAKVTDWNEVYDQGYEVVKQKEGIVTIKLKYK